MEMRQKLGGPADLAQSKIPRVSTADVEAVVSAWSGVPVEQMSSDEMKHLRQLQDSLKVCEDRNCSCCCLQKRLTLQRTIEHRTFVVHWLFLLCVLIIPCVGFLCAWGLDTGLVLLQAHHTPRSAASPGFANALQDGVFHGTKPGSSLIPGSCPRVSLNLLLDVIQECWCAGACDWAGGGGVSSFFSLEAGTGRAEGPQPTYCSPHVLWTHWGGQD